MHFTCITRAEEAPTPEKAEVTTGQETSNRSVGALTSAMDDQKIQGSSGLTPRRETRFSRLRNDGVPSPHMYLAEKQSPPKRTTPTGQECQAQPHITSMLGKQSEPPKTTTPTVPESAGQDSMNRKLKFDSSDFARRRSAVAEKAPDAPSFDLCTPPDENEQQAAPVTHACQGRATTSQGPALHLSNMHTRAEC